MKKSSTLIDRLSKLDAPDREVDAEIWLIELQSAESDPFGGYGLAEDWRYEYEAEEDGSVIQYARNGQLMHKIDRRSSPAFTASVDAAIALAARVLPESVARRLIVFNSSPAKAGFDGTPESGKLFYFEAATPAIAACIALLRAKEANHV